MSTSERAGHISFKTRSGKLTSRNSRKTHQKYVTMLLFEILALMADQTNVPACESNHNAVSQMNSKGSNEHMSVTGVGGVVCGRHALMRPNGVVDLQKGERYVGRSLCTTCAESIQVP